MIRCALIGLLALLWGARAEAAQSADRLGATLDSLLRSGAFVQADDLARAVLEPLRSSVDGAASANDSASVTGELIDHGLRARIEVDPPNDSTSFRLASLAVRVHEREGDAARGALSSSLLNRGILRLEVDDVAGSREDLSRALALRRAVSGDSSLEEGSIRLAQARLALKGADFATATEECGAAIALRARRLGSRDAETIRARLVLASTRRVRNDFAGASAAIDSIFADLDPTWPDDHPVRIVALQERGMIRWRQSRFAEARADQDAAVALSVRRFGSRHTRLAEALNRRSYVEAETGDVAAALADLTRAQEIFDANHGPEHPKSLNNANAHAILLFNMGDYAGAKQLAQRVVEIRRRTAPGNYVLGETLTALAGAEEQLGESDSALAHLDEALAVHEKTLGPDHGNVAFTLRTRGGLLLALGDVARGTADLERAVAIQEKVLGPSSTRLAYTLDDLAIARLRAGLPAEARRLNERALGIRRAKFGPDDPEVATSLMKIARLDYDAGARDSALALALRSEESGRNHLRLEARNLTDREALRLTNANIRGLDLLVTLAADSIGLSLADRRRVFDTVIRTRGAILEEMTSRRRGALSSTGAESDSFAGVSDRFDLGLDEVAASLPPQSVLVSDLGYMHRDGAAALQKGEGDRHPAYAAFVLRAGDPEIHVVDLGPAGALDTAIRRWVGRAGADPGDDPKTAERAASACRADGEIVRRLLWDPIAAYVEGAERVFLVPDGTISLVNPAALPAAKGRFLVEDGPLVHILTVERDLVPETAGEPRGRGLLAFGAPDFDRRAPAEPAPLLAAAFRGPHSPCLDSDGVRFEPLPGAREELDRVARVWRESADDPAVMVERRARGAAELRVGADASEDLLRRVVPGRQVVHIATHGFFLGDSCGTTAPGRRGIGAVVAAPARKPPAVSNPTPPPAALDESAYFLSGLALAGANLRDGAEPGEDDGILTADEASALDLSAADWVVLSGCDTGLGRTSSYNEGVEGLRRGFRVAGARCVLMSLWPVADEPTVDWMDALYSARFLRGLDTAEAVRAADRELLAARRAAGRSDHPFFWAAFVAAGDWR